MHLTDQVKHPVHTIYGGNSSAKLNTVSPSYFLLFCRGYFVCVCSQQCHRNDIFLRKELGWSQPNLGREHFLLRKGGLIQCYGYSYMETRKAWKKETDSGEHEQRAFFQRWKKSIKSKNTSGIIRPLLFLNNSALFLAHKRLQIAVCKEDPSFGSFPAAVLPGALPSLQADPVTQWLHPTMG